MLIFINKVEDLFKMVKLESLTLSDQVGSLEQNANSRLPEVIPITDADETFFNIQLNRACPSILEKIGPYTEDSDYPYEISDADHDEYPLSVLFKITLPDDVKVGVAVPLLAARICEVLVSYTLKEWLSLKGFHQYVPKYEQKYTEALSKIRSAVTYGHKVERNFRSLN